MIKRIMTNAIANTLNTSFSTMKQVIETNWIGQKSFESTIGNHKVVIDTSVENGGNDNGVRAIPLLMSAFAGCMGINIVSFLSKMKIDIEELKITTEGTLNDDYPQSYTSINAIYSFKGKDLKLEKLEEVISKSEEKYCGVSTTLKKALTLTSVIQIVAQ